MDRPNQPSGNPDRLARDVQAFAEHESHPEPSVLAAYQARTLPEEEDDAIQEHLARCRHCAALVLDLEELLTGVDPTEQPGEPLGEAANAAVIDFPSRPFQDSRSGADEIASAASRRAPLPPRWLAWAAALVLATTTYQVGRWQASEAAKQPQIVVSSPTILASGSQRSLDEEFKEISLPATVEFHFTSETRGRVVQFEFKDRDGHTVRKLSGARVSDTSGVLIHLSRGSLAPGRYEVLATFPQGSGSEGDSTRRFLVAVR